MNKCHVLKIFLRSRSNFYRADAVVQTEQGKQILLFGIHREALRSCLGDDQYFTLGYQKDFAEPSNANVVDLDFLRAACVIPDYDKEVANV